MEIQILHLVEGAMQARGLTVIIDVFRAFSTACYVIGNGASQLLCVGEVETAFDLKKEDPGRILMGERNEQMVKGFQYGNSPFQVESLDFTGKCVVHTTSAGTRGMVSAAQADEILAGSFVNADATVDYIRKQDPPLLSLVCMGYAAQRPVEEDSLCAEYMRERLGGSTPDFDRMAETIRKTSGRRFFNAGNQEYAPSSDFYLCMELNRFDFAVKATPLEPGILSLKPVKNAGH